MRFGPLVQAGALDWEGVLSHGQLVKEITKKNSWALLALVSDLLERERKPAEVLHNKREEGGKCLGSIWDRACPRLLPPGPG